VSPPPRNPAQFAKSINAKVTGFQVITELCEGAPSVRFSYGR
jgi:hypothetical protein